MCVIVDANCCHRLFCSPPHPDYIPVFAWINDKDGILVYGGKLARELLRNEKMKRLLVQWDRAGRARRFSDDALAPAERRIVDSGFLRSDDPHILALAIVSQTRTICTEDRDLWTDFKDRRIVPFGGCRIYRRDQHNRLLRHSPGCSGFIVKSKIKEAAKREGKRR